MHTKHKLYHNNKLVIITINEVVEQNQVIEYKHIHIELKIQKEIYKKKQFIISKKNKL